MAFAGLRPYIHEMRPFRNVSDIGGRPARFAVVVSPGFGMLSYASVVDVLKQMRDYLSGQAIEWTTLTTSAGLVRASNGLEVMPQGNLFGSEIFEYLVIIGSVDSAVSANRALEAWIRHQYSRGAIVCATASGTWVLASAGLLRERRCTLHWRDIDNFRETYPDVRILNDVYVIDQRIVTCSGARTASDMIYSLLSERFGMAAIQKVRQMLFHERLIQPHESQPPLQERLQTLSPNAYLLMREIEEGLAAEESIGMICDRLKLKRRTMEKAFQRHLGRSPKQYQLGARLHRAANLLKKSQLTITEIAEATGFCSASALHGAFSQKYGCAPRQYRRDANAYYLTEVGLSHG
jgi:transcriptional regulator GlxA family with amidase domain